MSERRFYSASDWERGRNNLNKLGETAPHMEIGEKIGIAFEGIKQNSPFHGENPIEPPDGTFIDFRPWNRLPERSQTQTTQSTARVREPLPIAS